MGSSSSTAERGFTLIELSIVLVVIGLIVGGVLVGQDLVRAAGERATIAQIEKFNTATNTFFEKYSALPGDIANPQASVFGFYGRGQYGGEGDNNHILQGIVYDQTNENYGPIEWAGETAQFWVDLSTAHLIDGGFKAGSEKTPPSSISTTQLNAYFPQAKLGNGNFIYVYNSQWIDHQDGTTYGINQNWFGLSAPLGSTSGPLYGNPGLTVRQAYEIDVKVDDGMPLSGNVIAQYSDGVTFPHGWVGYAPNASTPDSTTCYDTTSKQYSVNQASGAGINCALSLKMQAGD